MSISKRLYLAFGMLALALCAAGIAEIVLLSQSQARFEYVQNKTIPSIEDLDKVIKTTNGVSRTIYQHVLTTDASKRAAVQANLAALLKTLGDQIGYYAKNDISDEKDREMTHTAQADLAAVNEQLPPLLAAIQTFGLDRIMFSVDYPYSHNEQGAEYLKKIDLPPADMAKFAHGTADKLLKLKA